MAAFAWALCRFSPVIHVLDSRFEFPDEIPIFTDVAVQGRMIGLVHRDLEPVYGPFGHIPPRYLMLSRDNIRSSQEQQK